MPRRRTTALGLLAASLLLGLALAGGAGAAKQRNRDVPTLVFPVAAPTTFTDDFGDPRSDGPPHPGNDLLAARKSPAVAAEAGTVTFWTTSATAGCMLYLHGDSGTTYQYIHLNNDLTKRNDNRGKCVAGVAYARGLKSGARVEAGQLVGYVGDSGDANGIHPHLHFEVHPNDGAAVDPYPYLQAARHLFFFGKDGTPFALVLQGKVVGSTDGSLQLDVTAVRSFPGSSLQRKLGQTVTLTVPATAQLLRKGKTAADGLAAAVPGEKAVVWTEPALASRDAELGADGALAAAIVQLG
jgi:hypothetical protein